MLRFLHLWSLKRAGVRRPLPAPAPPLANGAPHDRVMDAEAAGTRTFRKMHGGEGGRVGVDEDFAAGLTSIVRSLRPDVRIAGRPYRYVRRPRRGIGPNFPAWKSVNACAISTLELMTNGPPMTTGCRIGGPL